MLIRKEKLKNSGMTLVEVLVSMLVLSIAVVTVMTTFSMANKVNLKSEQMQSVESLMENLLEYAEAGGTDYETTFLSASGTASTPSVVGSKTIQELSSVRQGFYNYKVRITTDTEPTEYETTKLNNHGVIQFGSSDSNAVMLDVSGANASFADDIAMSYFLIQHMQAVDEYNNGLDPSETPLEVMQVSDIWDLVTRELWLMTESPNPDKVTICAYMVYEINNAALKYPDDVDTTHNVFVWRSEEYDTEGSTVPNPKKLNQMYLLYSNSANAHREPTDIDIRILDLVGSSLDTSFYFVMQEEVSKSVANAVSAATFTDRIGDINRALTLNISFRDPRDSGPKCPKATRIYCTTNTMLEDANSTVQSPSDLNPTAPLSIVTKAEEVRVVTVTFEILDANSGAILDTKTITRLQ